MGKEPEASRTIRFHKNEIEYTILRKPVKNINIRVHPDMSVRVSAGPKVPTALLDDFVTQKAGWILKCLEKYEARGEPVILTFSDGEAVRILGRKYTLKAAESKKEEVRVDSEGGRVFLLTKDPNDAERKKRLYEKWLSSQCEKVFGVILEQSLPLFAEYKVPRPELKIRKMRARWGSCAAAKKIVTLNRNLIGAPKGCIEYVVVHELAHFVHQNHSKAFYDVVRRIMPDYKERKKLLNK